jgi:predicted nucleic acid-binding protein
MAFVLDTSVTMAWCFEDEATGATDAVLSRLANERAVVPPLWRLEVANVLIVAERRGRMTEAQSGRFVSLLSQLPIDLDSQDVPVSNVADAARRHGLSSYDAAYLLLAQRRGLSLATLDEALSAAASAAGVALTLKDR